jgi:uncharacterized protein (DUF58 family)
MGKSAWGQGRESETLCQALKRAWALALAIAAMALRNGLVV